MHLQCSLSSGDRLTPNRPFIGGYNEVINKRIQPHEGDGRITEREDLKQLAMLFASILEAGLLADRVPSNPRIFTATALLVYQTVKRFRYTQIVHEALVWLAGDEALSSNPRRKFPPTN